MPMAMAMAMAMLKRYRIHVKATSIINTTRLDLRFFLRTFVPGPYIVNPARSVRRNFSGEGQTNWGHNTA